ncbi:MAG: hypothetical protein R8M46_09905 [Ghiorsea sp.]
MMSKENITSARETLPNLDGYNYYILKSQDPDILSARVQALLDHGWQASGNLVAAAEGDGVAYAQVMTKAV